MLVTTTFNYAQTQPTKPYQFIAKIWTEALGRIVDPPTWQAEEGNIVNEFSYFQNLVRLVYKSSEFYNDYPISDSDALWRKSRLLALYRGALNREPDEAGFNSYLPQFNDKDTWEYVVDCITGGTEFSELVNTMIYKANNGLPHYGWGTTPPLTEINKNFNSTKRNFNGTEDDLQLLLTNLGNKNEPDSVTLAPMAVIYITKQLKIPANIVLTTEGNPSNNKYAKMARLVKQKKINTDMISLAANSVLKNVWIDGSFGRVLKETANGDNACVTNLNNTDVSSDGLKILNCRFTDASGSDFIKLHTGGIAGSTNSRRILDYAEVKFNLITAYSTSHMKTYPDLDDPAPWTEGIDIGMMKNGLISENQIVDITDGAICLFHTRSIDTYNTQIQFNQILNAGNSAVAGIVFDQEYNTLLTENYDYSGAFVHHNTIWTSPTAHIDRVLHIGCNAEYRIEVEETHSHADTGTHGSFCFNTSGENSISNEIGVNIDGFSGVIIQDNSLNFRKSEAYHSRINGPFVRFSAKFSSGANTSQYPFVTFIDSPYISNGNRLLNLYIEGPDTIFRNQTANFYKRTLTTYNPSHCSWEIQDTSGAPIMEFIDHAGPLTISTSDTKYQKDLWIRLYEIAVPGEGWKSKFVKYIDSLPKLNDHQANNTSEVTYEYSLHNNYPNPFNPSTNIAYSLKENGWVQLSVFNILGQKVSDLVNQQQEAGNHSIAFNGANLPSGVYIYRIQSKDFSDTKKLILMK